MFQNVTNIPRRWIYFLLVALSFILYGNSIPNNYCIDDNFVVTDNAFVQQGLAGIDTILKSPYATIGSTTLDYRPIVTVTYAIENEFFGNNPHISHFLNILLFAFCLILIFKILSGILQLQKTNEWLPLVVTVLFAVHPIHTEVVDSLKNRDELLSMFFGLLFMLYGYKFYTSPTRKKWNVALSILFLALSLMSKITGVLYVPIFLFICWFKDIFKGNKRNLIFIGVLVLICFRGVYRAFYGVHRTTNLFENPLEQNTDLLIALGTSLKILLYHIRLLIYPHPLCFYYGLNVFPLNSITDSYAMASLILHAALFIFGIVLFRKRDMLGLFILLYFISFSLYSNFPVPYTGLFSERALLLSSLWFIGILTVLLYRLFAKISFLAGQPWLKKSGIWLLLFVFCAYAFMTIRRNFLWKDNLTLMSHDIPYLHNSVMANYMYANNLKFAADQSGDSAAARKLAVQSLKHYKRAIQIVPGYPEFYFKAASVYQYHLHKTDRAELYYKKAIELDSLYHDAYFELGKLYFMQNDFLKSYPKFENAYLTKPTDSLSLYFFAQTAAAVGDYSTCYKLNKEFIQLYPALPVSYVNMGIYYSKISKDDSAVIYFEKAIQLGYREKGLISNMELYFKNKNDVQKAQYYNRLLNMAGQ